ncbi:hypothetical protein [Pseudolysinimonas sp.]|uniref:hypothetical protein n=1 Tax=Pseudolysinimonas sp. TaxID=2680009 RepID=UPI003F80CB51
MHTGRGSESWLAREDSSVSVLTALYLRDALGVVDVGGMPRLRGTGLPEAEPADMRTSWAWMRWWIPIVEDDRPQFALLTDLDEDAGRAIGRHLDSARTWAAVAHAAYGERAAAHRDLTVTHTVRERERELGRRARPFRLRIEVLPLVESGLWWIGENAVAVDDVLRDEPILFADALRPVVEQLA